MAWVEKGGRAYEYRSVRKAGRVTSEYVGGASIPADSAAFFRDLEAGRRAERATDRLLGCQRNVPASCPNKTLRMVGC